MSLLGKGRTIETERLLLRDMVPDDAESMFDVYSDPETMKYWACPPVSSIDEALKLVREDLGWVAEGRSLVWSVTIKPGDRAVGKCILFNHSEANRRAELGFILAREHWRKGLMLEAVDALIDFSFGELGLHRLEADVDVENSGSLGLLERLGFRREGFFRDRWCVYGDWQDSVMLGLLDSDRERA